jgi:hypothetical protein
LRRITFVNMIRAVEGPDGMTDVDQRLMRKHFTK